MVATIAVIFLPLFAPSVVDRTLLVLQNVVLLTFLALLLCECRGRGPEGMQRLRSCRLLC